VLVPHPEPDQDPAESPSTERRETTCDTAR
jgi:hypothetical protein